MGAIVAAAGVTAEARRSPEPEELEFTPVTIGHEAEAALALSVVVGQAKNGVGHGFGDWGRRFMLAGELEPEVAGQLRMAEQNRFQRNPYIDLCFADLSDVCGRAAAELGQKRPRTPDERAELVEKVRLLLIACQRALWEGETTPGTPELDLSRGLPGAALDELYMALFERRVEEQRLEVLRRATDFVLRDPDAREAFLRAAPAGDDASLREALGRLSEEWEKKGRRG